MLGSSLREIVVLGLISVVIFVLMLIIFNWCMRKFPPKRGSVTIAQGTSHPVDWYWEWIK